MAARIKVLIAKPGLDGHDQGAKVVARALVDAGCEVVYTGLRQSAQDIAQTALEEDVAVIGLSIMSGSHLPFCRKLKPLLEEKGLERKLWIIGGYIPEKDRAELEAVGLNGIFPIGTPLDDIVAFIKENVQ